MVKPPTYWVCSVANKNTVKDLKFDPKSKKKNSKFDPKNKAYKFDPVPTVPVDGYRVQDRCCQCVPQRLACSFVCFMSFFWGSAELVYADKFMARFFPDRGKTHQYCMIGYWVMVMGFLLASLILAVGIILKKHFPLRIYIWCGFIFNFVYIAINVVSIGILIYGKKFTKKQALRTVCGIFWNCLYFYLLIVVNSYRLALWVYDVLDKSLQDSARNKYYTEETVTKKTIRFADA